MLVLVLCLVCAVSGIQFSMKPPLCDQNASQHINWLFKLKANRKCVQIISVLRNSRNDCLFNSILELPFSFLVRDVESIQQQNIFNYDLSKSNESNANIRVCENYIIFSDMYQSIFSLFEESVKSNNKRFYPYSTILIISKERPIWTSTHTHYFSKNAIHIFWLSQDRASKSFEFIENSLANVSIHLPEPTNKVDKFVQGYKHHPTFRSGEHILRVSLYYCLPYIIVRENSTGAER